jgi:hypothetical protein
MPSISPTSRPGYVYDSATDTWIPIGIGPHTHAATDISGVVDDALIDAKGDLLVGTAADTVGRLAVGANNTVLTADSSTASGLKWATPSSGGMTLISTTSMTGSTTITLSSIPSTYVNLLVLIKGFNPGQSNQTFTMRFANDTGSSYWQGAHNAQDTTVATSFDLTNGTTLNASQNQTSNFFAILIPRYAAAERHTVNWFGSFIANASNTTRYFVNLTGLYDADTAVSQLDFILSGGLSWNSGTIYLYGVK